MDSRREFQRVGSVTEEHGSVRSCKSGFDSRPAHHSLESGIPLHREAPRGIVNFWFAVIQAKISGVVAWSFAGDDVWAHDSVDTARVFHIGDLNH